MFTTLSFLWTKNSITACCLKQESATDAILKIHYSSTICRNVSNCVCAWEKHQISSLQNCTFLSLLMAEKNNVGQTFLNNLHMMFK
jgi:hypothetical protein